MSIQGSFVIVLTLIAIQTILSALFIYIGIKIMVSVKDLLAALSQLSADVDALIAKPVPVVDLQPLADAIGAIDAKVKAALVS